jgi:uncharacterized protein
MTPEERDLVNGLFARLKAADSPDKDPEAAELIRGNVTAFPAAPYLLAQTVLVQEQALNGAQARIAALEKELADAHASRPAQSTSFLGGLRQAFGVGGVTAPAASQSSSGSSWATRAGAAAPPAYQPQQQQWAQPTYAPPPAYGAGYGSGGGFLRSALSTAAGVAGGALMFEGIERMLGHGVGPFGGYAGFGGSPWGGGMPAENVTVNNYYDGQPAERGDQHLTDGNFANNDPQVQDADYVQDDNSGSGFDDGSGGDLGGDSGGDWT